ncbi:MAG: DUF1670 domain-containing protein [Phycisphaerales bacterium]|nr:MAG: DUF1670 domain-containing protein [Phycisphaerales bacterium]
MVGKSDYLKKRFGPLQGKTLKNALAHAIGEGFPRIGGDRIRALCADMVLEVLQEHLRPREQVSHGQVLWMGVDVDDPPARGKRLVDTHLIPLVLDLSTSDDVQARLDRQPPRVRLRAKAIRLCEQAYAQGALLSNCDLAELLNTHDECIAHELAAHEREQGKVVPRRATLHDVGSGLTHKRIIVQKRYREGLSTNQIARQTYHSPEAVDRYLGQFDRVRHCGRQGLSTSQTAYTLNCSVPLVEEYLAIDRELEASTNTRSPRVAGASRRETRGRS